MDKIKVNIQVVTMRKFVKQAKTHVINRCTKQIKFLEKRKGKEEQIAKSKRKLQRLLEEVKILKKIKPDSVSKLALSKAKDWKAILAEKNISLEERCFAMLANHPPVQESVEKFHSDNTELIFKIPGLVKEWEEKKSRRSELKKKKEKSNQDDAKNPNKLPIGNNNNFHKPNKTDIKNENTLSLENQPDSSNLKNIQNGIAEQNLGIKKTNKRKNSSDNMSDNLDSQSILCSPLKRKLLVADNSKGNESDDSLSDNSDTADHQSSQSENEMSVKDQTKNDGFYENESDDSLSDSLDISNQSSPSKEKSLIGGKTKCDQSYENDSDDFLSDNSDITPHQSSQSEEKLQVKGKTKNSQFFKSGKIKETVIESNNEEISGKLPDIRSKLLEISMSKTKMQNKPINKLSSVVQQLNDGVESDSDDEGSAGASKKLDSSVDFNSTKTKPSKPEAKSKIKAITMLDLNELQDVDEIPIEKSDSEAEGETDEESGKPKKDPFFLCDGEIVSESDEDESSEKETERKRGFPSFKKKPYGNLNRRERRQNSFQNRQFNQHSANGKNSNFREKDFVKNKESSFKDNKRGFKRAFDGNSEHRQNKKFQFASKDKFSNRNASNNFTKNPKENSFSQNHNRDVKRNNYPPKNNPSNFIPKDKPDDKPLHPSWEAKRKLKEAANVKFQGKRMVFKD